ncbi:MAG: FtsW/RodA/SpoVE family cell cycle protein [Streptococcaceae bacterium]|jgi:rod shape determining protein RodA|nr:FtsW/RodA/SpoVE family cell cycle protein [Streptococcaceae bacterium]
MKKTRRTITVDSRVDYGVILPVFLLSIIGMLSLYVALVHDPNHVNVTTMMIRQAAWYGVGIFLVFIVIHMSSRILWKLTPLFYIGGLGLMLLPIFFYDPVMAARTGSRNWVAIGSTNLFQPSELVKIAFILILAYLITQHNAFYTTRTLKTDFWLIGKMVGVTIPVMLTLGLQSDFGTGLVYIAILAGMIFLSGISWRILLPVFLGTVILGTVTILLVLHPAGRDLLYQIGFQKYQFARIDSWLDPFHDTSGVSFQQARALIAIGTGQLFGTGFNNVSTYVPVRESDMIFTVIGENFGFIGSTIVILLFFVLIYRMIRVTFESNNQYYTSIATGVIMMILFHVFQNIGANIGLLPLTGIPLPFISQGGSSIVSNLIGVGLILSMRYHTKPDYENWQKQRDVQMTNRNEQRKQRRVTNR